MWAWILHVTGCDNLSGPFYGFWSGFAGDIPELGALLLIARRFNCHARGCWRIGLHRVHGTHFTTCHRHHPDHPHGRAATAAQIADHYGRNHP